MHQDIKKKYRKIAIAISTLVIVVLCVILHFAYKDTVLLTKVQFNKQQALLASQSAKTIENNIEILVRELQTLASHTAIIHYDYDVSKVHGVLATTFKYVKKIMVNDIGLLDSNGTVRVTLAAPQLEGRDFFFREYFQKAKELKTNSPIYELIEFKGVEQGKKGLVIAVPIFARSESFRGVILFTLKISELILGLMTSHHDDGIFWALDSSGYVLFHPTYQPGTAIGELPNTDDSFKQFVKKSLKGQAIMAEYISPAGIQTIASSYPVKFAHNTWTIVIASPEKNISKILAPFSNKYLLIAFLIILLIITTIIIITFRNMDMRDEIDSRKLAEEKIREQNKFLNTIIESIPYPFYVIDVKDHSILLANSIAASVERWQGTTCHSLTHGRETPCNGMEHSCPIFEVKKKLKPVVVEHLHVDAEGKQRFFEVHGYPIFDDNENIIKMIELSIDINNRKKMENELLKTKKLAATATFAGGIAHDFNNLLAAIIGYLDLAKTVAMPDSYLNEYIQTAYEVSLQAKELTKKFITFSSGGTPSNKVLSIDKLVSTSVSLAMSGSNSSHKIILSDNIRNVKGDQGQLQLVFTNIIQNSLEAMPSGARVRVAIENIEISGETKEVALKAGRYVKISFQDDGAGIPENILPNIFDPYFSTKDRGSQKGMGLGLTTSYSIIKKHNGLIYGESKPGKGATFFIYLPATDEIINVKQTTGDLRSSILTDGDSLNKKKVLVMDDEKFMRDMTGKMLTSMGYYVETAKNGTEALEKYFKASRSDKSFWLILLDLTIKDGMGGKETVKKLREVDTQVNIIVFSGYSEDPILSNYSNYGFNGALAKPFEREELTKLLAQF